MPGSILSAIGELVTDARRSLLFCLSSELGLDMLSEKNER